MKLVMTLTALIVGTMSSPSFPLSIQRYSYSCQILRTYWQRSAGPAPKAQGRHLTPSARKNRTMVPPSITTAPHTSEYPSTDSTPLRKGNDHDAALDQHSTTELRISSSQPVKEGSGIADHWVCNLLALIDLGVQYWHALSCLLVQIISMRLPWRKVTMHISSLCKIQNLLAEARSPFREALFHFARVVRHSCFRFKQDLLTSSGVGNGLIELACKPECLAINILVKVADLINVSNRKKSYAKNLAFTILVELIEACSAYVFPRIHSFC